MNTSEAWQGRSRHRFSSYWTNASTSEEQCPLDYDRQSGKAPSNYSTFLFDQTDKSKQDLPPISWPLLQQLIQFVRCPTSQRLQSVHVTNKRWQGFPWKLASGLGFFTYFIASVLMSRYWTEYTEPRWEWDHNAYNPRLQIDKSQQTSSSDNISTGNSRNLLLAQVAGTPTLDELALVSSRPNRAYARSWGVDYVRYTNQKHSLDKSCFDKVNVLNTVLTKQFRYNSEAASTPSYWPSQRSIHVQYDVVVLLPPDAIIMDLDYDMLRFLPKDKLVAISGWVEDVARPYSGTEIIFFNMRHKLAEKVSKLWREKIELIDASCGAGNDLTIFINVIGSVLGKGEELSSLILGLEETDEGFVGKDDEEGFVLKGISPSVPSSKAKTLVTNLNDNRATLQTTADAVCYRFYPKCDVL